MIFFLNSNYPSLLNATVVCEPRTNTTYSFFVQHVWKLVDMSMYAFIPFTIMLTSSLVILIRIAQQSKKMSGHEHKSAAASKQESRFNARTRNLALMLLPVNVMFLVFVGPVVVAVYTYKNLGEDHLALFTVEALSLCNFTLNFFVYFLTSSKFREEFYKLVGEVRSKVAQCKVDSVKSMSGAHRCQTGMKFAGSIRSIQVI